ncbi:MAG: hypothetical protein ACOCQH_01965 [Halanaerobiales bacterium]
MKKRLLIIFLISLLLGTGGAFIKKLYITPLTRLYYSWFTSSQYIDPAAEINLAKNYPIDIWYYPFLRTVENEGEIKFFQQIEEELKQNYPGINFRLKKISFLKGHEKLLETLENGNPPDIYFNFGCDSYLDEQFQLPVQNYMQERDEDYNTLLAALKLDNNIWGWPFFCYFYHWPGAEKTLFQNFWQDLLKLPPKSLNLNYYDPLLLRQLLTLKGVSIIRLEENTVPEEVQNVLREIFEFMEEMRSNEIIQTDITTLIRDYLEKDMVVGPVNPWLNYYLQTQDEEMEMNNFPNLMTIFTLNVFQQQCYKGDDHTAAVMKTAERIAFSLHIDLKEKFRSYSVSEDITGIMRNTGQLLTVTPQASECWQQEILPAWYAFWEEELTTEEVMSRIIDKID